jgi:type I restriction enzyme S subunit
MAEPNNSKMPKIRFKGFGSDWEGKKLGEVLTERNVLQKIAEHAPILAFAAGQGVIPRSERKSNNRDHLTLDQANKVYKLTEYNDLVYNPSNLKYGAIDRNKYGRGVISPIYVTFTTKEIPCFIEPIIKSEKFKLKALLYEEGTVVKRQSVKPENLLSLDIWIPSISEEQTKIGLYFQELDRLIGLQLRKHDKLVMLKKAMLQKMFPQPGAPTPEIRFKSFEGNWVEKTLGESTTNVANNTLSRANLNYRSGLARNVHYGDILVRFGEVLDVQDVRVPFVSDDALARKLKSSNLENGDIVIADAAEDEAVGKCTEIQNVGDQIVLAGLHTIALRPLARFAPFYLGYYLNSNAFHDQLIPIMQGTKVLSISKTAIKQTVICFPTDEAEQQKIGTYFRTLDELISQNAVQLAKLKQLKSACLEKMFV